MKIYVAVVSVLLAATPVASFLGTVPPPLARSASSSQLHMSVPNPLDTLTSGLASVCRLPKGITVSPDARKGLSSEAAPRLLQLYDVENSAACRAVRERITELDLVVETVVPAAENSRVFRDPSYQFKLPVGAQIPRLVVAEANGDERVLVGDADICSFLDATHTDRGIKEEDDDLVQLAGKMAAEAFMAVGGFMSSMLRLGRGTLVTKAASPDAPDVVPRPVQPLILFSYEGNQFCRLVREVLTELDICYELRSAGKQSVRREELSDITGGSTQCPYLIDPNTGVQMAESADIIRYLYRTYALWTPPNELLQVVSNLVLPWFRPVLSALAPLQAGSASEDVDQYQQELDIATFNIEEQVTSEPVVIYTYKLSPFCIEAKALLDNLDIKYKEVSLGGEWIPGLIGQGGSIKRAALLEMTGQSSLPNIFIGGKSIGGLFSGTPGLVPALERGELRDMVAKAVKPRMPTLEMMAEAAARMAKPVADFESVSKLTKRKLQRALNMTDSASETVEASGGFW